MSKSDKDLESRTVANSPLQQSSFVFFPEEEKIRKKLLQNPDLTLQAAKNALEEQQKKVEKQTAFVAGCCQAAAKAAQELSLFAKSFAQKLPQSVFGIGNGEEFLLPLDLLFERIRVAEAKLNRLILGLDPFWQPDLFDASRFAFLDAVLPQANTKEKAEKAEQGGRTVRSAAQTLSGQIDAFLSTAVQPFFQKAGEAADLQKDGAGMRFAKLCALCGELQSAAGRFAGEWEQVANRLLNHQ